MNHTTTTASPISINISSEQVDWKLKYQQSQRELMAVQQNLNLKQNQIHTLQNENRIWEKKYKILLSKVAKMKLMDDKEGKMKEEQMRL